MDNRTVRLPLEAEDDRVLHVRPSGRITADPMTWPTDPLADLLDTDVYECAVVMNMSAVEFLDSSKIGWLATCHNRFKEQGGHLVSHSLLDALLSMIQVLRLYFVLNIVSTKDNVMRTVVYRTSEPPFQTHHY